MNGAKRVTSQLVEDIRLAERDLSLSKREQIAMMPLGMMLMDLLPMFVDWTVGLETLLVVRELVETDSLYFNPMIIQVQYFVGLV